MVLDSLHRIAYTASKGGWQVLYKEIWAQNVKTLLSQNNLSISEAARLVGTSKQYLSSILAETEPQSKREKTIERLSLLLHANPARLYAPTNSGKAGAHHVPSPLVGHLQAGLTAVEQAIMAERHFLSRDYAGSYAIITDLLQRYGGELSPIALVQAKLLAGKNACLLGYYEAAKTYIREAQALFQRRLTAQPEKYLSACLDAYRYLALVAHLEGNYEGALRIQQKGIALSTRYPELTAELTSKWETLGFNMLRTAVRTGRQSMLVSTAEQLSALSARVGLPELAERVRFEVDLSAYAVARVSLHNVSIPKPPCLSRDPLQHMAYGLVLWDRGEFGLLENHITTTVQDTGSPDHSYAVWWLNALMDKCTLSPECNGASPTSLAMGKIAFAWKAYRASSKTQAFHYWQDCLFELRALREIPLYLLVYSWGIREFPLDEYIEILKATADRALAAYTR